MIFSWVAIVCACVGDLRASNATMPSEDFARAVVTNYANVLFATYDDTLAAVLSLRTAVGALLAHPGTQTLASARDAWRRARIPYSQSEAARFYDGPIDQVEAGLNAWPLDEAYIDYVAENPGAGIINMPAQFPAITREVIQSLNQKEGKKSISTGYHAVEFLLWGQDRDVHGPGNRPWQDYSPAPTSSERRRAYLRIATDLLVEQCKWLAGEWRAASSTNYRARFVAMAPAEALGSMLKGLGAMSGPELSGERLTVAYETKEQEDEQSCFSDNTRDDVINNAVGIQNLYLGQYVNRQGEKISGPGIHDLLLRVEAPLAEQLAREVRGSIENARNIPQPFDQAVLGANTSASRKAIKRTIVSLQTESDLFARAAAVLCGSTRAK